MSASAAKKKRPLYADPRRQVEEARASLALSGGQLSPESAADAEAYASGSITMEEYKRRTLARYGLTE